MMKMAAAATAIALLLAGCGGTANNTTASTSPAATTTVTIAGLTCDEYVDLASPINGRVGENMIQVLGTGTLFNEGSVSVDDFIAVLLTTSERFSDNEEDWLGLRPPPPFELFHEYAQQAVGKFSEGLTIAVLGLQTEDQALLDESDAVFAEGAALLSQAGDAMPSSC